ncbi:3-carboxymuconate cyclase [Paenibacillus sp. CAA11]|uniref:lactonase family protein n=1 Tax=Paenibacillus sp. CAA11 TaxID=1532905 RepID=UPI000D3B93A7|nr:lactonase family protein [Paenibacillus sp. CAA11]AWB44221.1 3-carboxymuconate cyclase [Paenibacillus sp. CAA11]
MSKDQKLLLFIGSYAEAENSGVYVYEMNEETGSLTRRDEVSGLKNPTFLNVDTAERRLYSIGESALESGGKAAEAVAFSIDGTSGKLTELNREVNLDATTCHINRDSSNQVLIVSSYHGGKVGLVQLEKDGRVGKLLDEKQHEGRGAHPERQDRPHVHSAFFSPDERFLFVNDLGLDIVRAYTVDLEQGKLHFHADIKTEPGAGPRHLAFHPSGNYVYVMNEVNSTIASFRYEAATGHMEAVQVVSTLPDDFEGENTTAEIAVSQDGRFVYGSNRGHDSLVVYAVDDKTGELTLVERISSEGAHPRHFALSPNGNHLIAANRDTNNLVTFKVDKESGRLKFTGVSEEVSKPVCVKPVYM